jgi:hypothetical protein
MSDKAGASKQMGSQSRAWEPASASFGQLYRENDPHEIIGLLGYQFSSSGVKHPFMNI